ncbi:MAG TPA: substrate-binding domain-containing protein [Armatimonadota bacterium]|jgi:DNA-binding LacI/PurR family transcriptional regulator/DNA-binding transcriptional regulator YhcF (GntR family)
MKSSQRQQIVNTLREEILAGVYASHAPLPGEHPLCQRFQVSRTTLRLALGDLAQRGLIYRRHGSGTYVNPVRSVMPRPLALLLLEPQKAMTVGNLPLISGAGGYLESVGSHLAIISTPPTRWSAELIDSLAGVMVLPPLIEASYLAHLAHVQLPTLVVTESELPCPGIQYGFTDAVSSMVETLLALGHRRFALLSGHDAHGDRIRKQSILRTLAAAGIDSAAVPDVRTNYDPAAAWEAAQTLLALRPRPTAIIAFDDTLALQMIRAATEQQVAVPGEMSVVGFGDAPHASLVSPTISTVQIPAAEGGRRAAEMLCRACLYGEAVQPITLAHTMCWRESSGPAPTS